MLPNSKSARTPDERQKVRRVIIRRNLCGLANDTKWDEFIDAMRAHIQPAIQARTWRPSFRFKCVDGPPSGWDPDWSYHLPFPMISVEWLDIAHEQEITDHRLPPRTQIIDHSNWIEEILAKTGLQYQKGKHMIRVFGYSPKNLALFE